MRTLVILKVKASLFCYEEAIQVIEKLGLIDYIPDFQGLDHMGISYGLRSEYFGKKPNSQ